jgi:hypothetical protein
MVCLVACVASNGTQVPDCLVVCKNTFIFAEPQHMYLVVILVAKLLVCAHQIFFWSNRQEHCLFIKQEGKTNQTVQRRAYLDEGGNMPRKPP